MFPIEASLLPADSLDPLPTSGSNFLPIGGVGVLSLNPTAETILPPTLTDEVEPLFVPTSADNNTIAVGDVLTGSNAIVPLNTTLSVDPGNSIATALDIGFLTGDRVFSDRVDITDEFDVFQFSLENTSSFRATLTNLSADADLYLVRDFNGDGGVDSNEVVAASERFGTRSETINLGSLTAGNYLLFVAQYQGTATYDLTLSATPSTNTENSTDAAFDPILGFGLVDAAAAVALALGNPEPFPDVPNPTSTVPSNFADLSLLNVPEVWNQGITGEGVVVAVLDTGVDINHPELADSIFTNPGEIPNNGRDDDGNGYVDDVHGWDFGDRDNTPTPGRERGSEHGTHVAGTIAANLDGIDVDARGLQVEVQGVAPGATILPVRVLGGRFGSTSSALAAGIRYAVDNGADVINLSLGSATNSSAVIDALAYAETNGVVVVSAAGNEATRGATAPSFPARDAALTDFGIAVGALDRNLVAAPFSNPAGTTLGEYPYVLAPGVQVISTVPNNRYSVFSGTSMATPHVAGVVALLLEANPNLTPEEVENILIATSSTQGLTA